MIAPLFFLLLIISGFGIGALMYVADPRLMIALLTVWIWTAIYGITYYQVKWTMRLFRRKRPVYAPIRSSEPDHTPISR